MSVIFDPNRPFKANQFVDNEFYLRVELYYAQPPQHNFVRAANSAEVMKQEVSQYANKFKCVQTKLFLINKALQGLSTFVPIQFDREYTALAMATLHSSVIDFKFSAHLPNVTSVGRRGLHSASDDESEPQHEQSHTFMENGILVERKLNMEAQATEMTGGAAAGETPSPGKGRLAARSRWQPHNIAEYLFFNDRGQLEISEDSIRQTYAAYSTILSNAHRQLRENYEGLA